MGEPWFSIVLEAKMRAMVEMFRKTHPDWSKQSIQEAMMNLLNRSVEAVFNEVP